MSDHSPLFGRPPDPRLLAHVDVEGKLLRALDAVARVAGSDVALVGADGDRLARGLLSTGARLTAVADPACLDEVSALLAAPLDAGGATVAAGDARNLPLPDSSADVVVGAWSVYRGVEPDELTEADRVLRPGGRLAIIHDYGRDDLSSLGDPDRPELSSWSRRGGPFLRAGFKIRVVHGWCTFDSLETAAELLGETFGTPGTDLARTLRRARLSYNVAVYHRVRQAA